MNRQCHRIPPSIDISLKKGDRPSTGNMLTHSQAPLQCINEVFFFGGKGGGDMFSEVPYGPRKETSL